MLRKIAQGISLIIRTSLGKGGLVPCGWERRLAPNWKRLFPRYDCSQEILRSWLNGIYKPLSNKILALQTETLGHRIKIDHKPYMVHLPFAITRLRYQLKPIATMKVQEGVF